MGKHCLDLVPTKPDRTQYQVMRMMNGLEIKHSRILNISDIRDTQSKSLAVNLESKTSDLHSIFSEGRHEELQNIYSSLADDAFIFLAWGRDIVDCVPFKQLAERCISTLPQQKVVLGIPGEDYLKFMHPWPRGRGVVQGNGCRKLRIASLNILRIKVRKVSMLLFKVNLRGIDEHKAPKNAIKIYSTLQQHL